MRSSRLIAVAAACLWSCAHATTALADDDRATSDGANTSLALQKFDEGRTALEAGDFNAAFAAFDASNRLLASPNSLLYMARCHKALGRTASAYTTFRLAYKQSQDRLVATGDKRYVATRDSAAKEAAEIEADVPKLAIIVPETVPNGLVVKQNGANVGRDSWGSAIDTDPGKVVIEASGPRLVPYREEVELTSGETKRVDVRIARVPTGVVRVRLAARPIGLALRIDEQPIDPNEAGEREVDPGPHSVEVSAPGYLPYRWQGVIADGQTSDIDVKLDADTTASGPKKLTTAPWMFFATGGAALATLGTATVLAIDADARSNDEQDKSPLARDERERDTIRSESTVANVLFITGAVFAIGTGVLAFTTDWKSKERTTAKGTSPRVMPRGLGIGGTF